MIVSDLGLFRYEYHVRIGTVAAAQSYQPSAISDQPQRGHIEKSQENYLYLVPEFEVKVWGGI
jgi:hypothetical protein